MCSRRFKSQEVECFSYLVLGLSKCLALCCVSKSPLKSNMHFIGSFYFGFRLFRVLKVSFKARVFECRIGL